ncbi:MAG: hypothetical protein A2017_01405 [Lentisphaerae bacterium GWF2_44_16]|nr:MAG: hypothetical protein A2017_01405 [Lentisphaerae bacterium GWF2_44_16]
MNSKERVKAALEKRPTDKIPLGFYAVDHDVISKVIGRPTYLRNKPGFKVAVWEGRRDEVVESMKRDVVDFYKKIDCVDLLTFKEAHSVPPKGFKPENVPDKIDDKTWRDKDGVWKLEPEANDIMFMPDKKSDELREYSVDEFSDRNITEPDISCFELSEHLIRNFGKEKYIAGYSGGITAVTRLGGTEAGLMTMALQPDVIKACNEQMVFRQNILDRYNILPGVDGVLIEQDMAGTNGPMISPEMFRELCYPYYRRRIENIKKHVPHVILHNCGNNLPIMDMLVEGGIDAYESIQTNSAMSIKTLAGLYGERLCIWGAVSLEALISGTVSDVRRDVRRCFEEAQKAKGFILGPSHSIAFGTKYDNFMAMLDEFVKLRDR